MAPPPMTAPPQVQAQSLARAIRTDIATPCSKLCGEPGSYSKATGVRFELCEQMQKIPLRAMALTTMLLGNGRQMPV
jgi:hypothetical protein